ncbi:MAG: hypothetical protein RI897_4690, partial [Verrucomicrobiota bacterium]
RQAQGLHPASEGDGLVKDPVFLPDGGKEHGLKINHDETGVGTSNAMGHGGCMGFGDWRCDSRGWGLRRAGLR